MSVNSWIRRQFKNAVSPVDTLASGMGAGDTSFLFTDGSTFPDGSIGPFICTIDQGQSNEEKVQVATRSGTAGTIATGGRGYNGTTASSHLSGASILHTIDQQDLDEANQVAVQTLGQIAAVGDLLTGSGVNALVKTSAGADGEYLKALSTAPGGVSWGALPTAITWTTVSAFLNGATSSGTNRYGVLNGVVWVQVSLTIGSMPTVFALPSALWPSAVMSLALGISPTVTGTMLIDTSGNVSIYPSSGSGAVATVSYPLG